ncbi:MAG: hypothetical protein KIS96_10855 [Bauldia sp.]|nr:hypothetical protein [Bauldia sp.]
MPSLRNAPPAITAHRLIAWRVRQTAPETVTLVLTAQTGEVANYAVKRDDLRRIGEALLKAAEG